MFLSILDLAQIRGETGVLLREGEIAPKRLCTPLESTEYNITSLA